MSPSSRYDINAEWDDPYERQAERRTVRRFPAKYKVRISVPLENQQGQLVGVSVVRDVSLRGILVQTKHELAVGQRIKLAIPTKGCTPDMMMPRSFWGMVDVRHLRVSGADTLVGLVFGEEFLQDMDFARFIEYLQSLSSVMSPS